MTHFFQAQASHTDWQNALDACCRDIRRQIESRPADLTLGWCYLTDYFSAPAADILAALGREMPGVNWVGTSAYGVAAGEVEYIDQPAMVLMLADLPPEQFQVIANADDLAASAPGFEAYTALVHAVGSESLAGQLQQLSAQTATGYLFGGLSSARNRVLHLADGVLTEGVSGVAFGPEVALLSRVSQGCQPIGPQRSITRSEGNLLVTLDGQRALDCVLHDLGLPADIADDELREILATTLAGLTAVNEDVPAPPGAFGTNTEVRHLVGVGRKAGVLVVAEPIKPGMRLAFCTRNADAAKHDLLRIIREIRNECGTARRIDGALYISCSGRGGPHFGARNAEFELVSHELGPEIPLVGFFAGGEIARHHLYGYTGVLTVFTSPAEKP